MFMSGFTLLGSGALVLALALAAVLASWRASANWRRTILVWGFVGALLAPVLVLALERTPAPRAVAVATSWARPRVDPLVEPLTSKRWQRTHDGIAPPRALPDLAGFFWLIGLGGAGVVLARLGLGHFRVMRFVRRARQACALPVIARAERIAGAHARVAFSKDVQGPIATGVLWPNVLLPEAASTWSDARLYTVLVHELTHVRQRDALAQLVAEIACALQWWNPLAWWAKRLLEQERELAADERVLASGILASDYAEQLLAIAVELDGLSLPRVGVPVLGRSKLARRIERILARDRAGLPGRLGRVTLPLAMLAATLVVACASVSRPATPARARSAPARASNEPSSIQPRIQRIVDQESSHTRQEWSARAVSVVVLEPSSGRVLALANPALASVPHVAASTFKPLLVAAALESGAIQPDDRFDCEQGERKFANGLRLRDAHPAGMLSVSEILEQSSNIGASKIFDRLGGRALTVWFARFHLSEAALDAEPGSLAPLDESSAGSLEGATIATGFGAKLSPIHIASLYGAFANQGLYVAPTLDAKASAKPERVLEAATAKQVLGMLESVVEKGTGKAARIDGVRVAGKTGTADLDDAAADGASIAYFAGIVPVERPRFVIVVMVEDPKRGGSGGSVAAPLFARIASHIL